MVKDKFTVNRTAAKREACTAASAKVGRTVERLLHSGGERGAALVEFALVVPLMMAVVFGMCSFGLLFNRYLELTEAVNVGAEQLAIARGNSLDPCNLVYSYVKQVSPLLNSTTMQFQFELNTTWYPSSTTFYTGSATTCSSASTSSGAPSNLIQGDPVTVIVQYPCSVLAFKFGSLVNFNPVPTCNLQAQITEISQ
jgi:Flp pilus assembly protein TadG